jgi:outer membrane murein-binding lipoprotein Lpp
MSAVETAGLILTCLTIAGILLGGLGWWINQKIKEATYQIQPNSNGGKSLADLHNKFDVMADDVKLLKKAVVQLEDDMEDMREH